MTIDWKGKAPAIAFLALSSCSSGPSEINGNLGNGTFSYTCVSTDDPACATDDGNIFTSTPSTTAAVFPDAVASGGRFKLAYDPKSNSAAGNPTLKPVSPAILDTSSADGSILALRPGKDGLVVRSSVDGLVFDFTYITIVPISALGVIEPDGTTPPDSVTLSEGSKETFIANALGPRNEKLAGAVDYTWSVSDPTVLQLGHGNPTARIDVMALTGASGKSATLTVTQGTMTKNIAIQVQ